MLWLIRIGAALSRRLNVLRGGSPEESLCEALGRSMQSGWARHWCWPRWFRRHCGADDEPPTFI